MLHTISADGYISWSCHNEYCDFYASLLTAHISHSTVRYSIMGNASRDERDASCYPLQRQRRLVDVDPLLDALLTPETIKQAGSGAVIALPQCLECGSQMFLKADYTLNDIIKHDILLPFIETDDNSVHGYVMKLSHARNFRLLNMLHALGKMPEKPILTTLPIEIIAHSPLAQYPLDIIDAFWLPFALTRKAPPIAGIYEPLMAMQHLLPEIIVPRIMAMEDRRIG